MMTRFRSPTHKPGTRVIPDPGSSPGQAVTTVRIPQEFGQWLLDPG